MKYFCYFKIFEMLNTLKFIVKTTQKLHKNDKIYDERV